MEEVKVVDTGVNIIEEINKLVESLANKEVIDENVSELTFKGTKLYGNEEQLKSFFSDYAKYFGEITNPKNTKVNPFHKSKYAPLDEVMNTIRPVMSKYGFSLIQIPAMVDGGVAINNLLTHKNGAYMTVEGLILKPQKPDAQGVGGAITYGRRYTASAIAGVMAEEDDDGNGASGVNKTSKSDTKVSTTTSTTSKSEKKEPTLTQLKNKTNTLAKEKIESEGQEKVLKLIDDILGKKLKDVTKDDTDKVNDLFTALEEM